MRLGHGSWLEPVARGQIIVGKHAKFFLLACHICLCVHVAVVPPMLACDVFVNVVSSMSWWRTYREHLGTSLKYATMALHPQTARYAYMYVCMSAWGVVGWLACGAGRESSSSPLPRPYASLWPGLGRVQARMGGQAVYSSFPPLLQLYICCRAVTWRNAIEGGAVHTPVACVRSDVGPGTSRRLRGGYTRPSRGGGKAKGKKPSQDRS